jgi:hydroxymethylpyrimidine/phosphomethylpyrimidine kinase
VTHAVPIALTIAGSDSSAGAGIQAGLKTFSALGVYGSTAITAVTAQNTQGVSAVHLVPGAIILAQIDAVFSDLNVKAVTTGMLGGAEGIEAVVQGLERRPQGIPIVVDPVLLSTSGSRLLEAGAEKVLIERLFPLASLVAPNLHEAAALLGEAVAEDEPGVKWQAARLHALGPRAVLIKGGHAAGPEAADMYYDGTAYRSYTAPRVPTKNTHGTGCTLSAAIAAFLAKGADLEEAIASAKAYLQGALEHGAGVQIGSGNGPVAHFYRGLEKL